MKNKRKKKIIIILFIICFMLLACSKSERYKEYEIPIYTETEFEGIRYKERDTLLEHYDDEYRVNKWTERQTGVESPYGICAIGDAIYVSDFSNHRIVKLNLEGSQIATYGQLGAEPGNFTNPTAIINHKNLIYVLDQGNNRIQIFDQEMHYREEVRYTGPVFSKTVYFQDMAVDQNGTIYLSEWEGFVDDAAVYYISENGIATRLEPHISGVLTEYQGEVYAINTYSLFYVKTATGLARGAIFGDNYLFRCTEDGLEQICRLPFKYAAGDLSIVDGVLYSVSLYDPLDVQMNRFTMHGELDSAIYNFERNERDYSNISEEPVEYPWYLEVVDDDHIYVVDSLWKTIYYLEKVE